MTLPRLLNEIGGWTIVVIGLSALIALAAFVFSLAVNYAVKQLGIFWYVLAYYGHKQEAKTIARKKGYPVPSDRPSDEEMLREL